MSTHKDEESKETKFIETILDLALTNEEQQIGNLSHLPPLGKSDHCILSFEFICEFDKPKALPKYQYHKADYQSMETDLRESKWKQNFLANNTADVSGLWHILKTKIHHLSDKYVPISLPEELFWKKKSSVPLSLEVLNMICKKSRLHRAWIRSQNEDNCRVAYRMVRNKVKEEIR